MARSVRGRRTIGGGRSMGMSRFSGGKVQMTTPSEEFREGMRIRQVRGLRRRVAPRR